MDQNELTNFISKLEEYSSVHPRRYRLRVMLLAALGYGYLTAVVIALLAIVYVTLVYVKFSVVTIKLVWIPLVLVGLILRSFWITIPEPDGRQLSEAEAQNLFALMREIQKELNGPTVHTVLLSDEFNAGIVQIPRFGMFGWLKNYLVVGLPLLNVLGPDQLRAVLAHEVGHLSGKHGHFSGWIYRIRASWIQILTAVHQERHYASFLFEPFLNWYAPFFRAYSFVLARMQEYEADASAAKLAGKLTAARALAQIAITQRALGEEFWPAFYRGAHQQAQPPKDPFAQMVREVGQTTDRIKGGRWLLHELRVKTGYDDTHPALADRLIAMGFEADSLMLPKTIESLVPHQTGSHETAANYYLNNVPEEFMSKSDRVWREQIVTIWREKHDEIQKVQRELAELEKKSETAPLSIEEQWTRVVNLGEIGGPELALNPLKGFLTTAPDHVAANFALGSILLEKHDAEGLKYLETAIQQNPSFTAHAYSLISDFHLEQGRLKEAEDYRTQALQFYETAQKLNEQAMTLSPKDRFESHGLTDEEVRDLRNQLARTRGLARAVLAQKVVEKPGDPIYVMGVIADYTWREGQNDKHIDALLEELASELRLKQPTVFVSLDVQKYLVPLLTNVPGSTIFAREGVVEAELEMRH